MLLNSGTLNASVNGYFTGNAGNLSIASNQSVIVNSDIGSSVALTELRVSDGATLDFATNNKSAHFAYSLLTSDSTIDIGSATLHGDIYANISENIGTINLHENYTLDGVLGVASFGVNIISVAAGKTITDSGNYDISANTITINDGASINTTGGGRLDGAVSLGNASGLTIGSGAIVNGSIQGFADNQGILNTVGGLVTLNSTIGATSHSLASFNIASGSEAAVSQNIIAHDVNFAGQLNLTKSGGNTITGNLTGSGSGTLDIGSGSHLVSGNIIIASGNTIAVDVANPTSAGIIYSAGTTSLSSNTILRISLLGTSARGSSYVIVNGGTGSTINKISDANILVGDTSSNRSGNLRFTTSVVDNELLLNVSGATAEGIARNKSQSNAMMEYLTLAAPAAIF